MTNNFQRFVQTGGAPLKGLGTAVKLGAGGLGIAWLGANSFFSVDGGHRAVMFDRFRGVLPFVRGEGMHLRIPWVQWPIIYDIRTKPKKLSSPTGTRDLQTVNVSLRVLYRPNPEKLPQILSNLGTNYDERVLPSIVNETLKACVARYNASQLITQREEVSRVVRDSLTERAAEFFIRIDDVSITHLSFSPEYAKAVEDKQVAQQDAERARYLVDKASQDKRSAIIKAEGEARSAKMIGDSIRENPGFLELRRLEAARNIAHIVSNSANRVYLDADALLMDLSKTHEYSLDADADSSTKSPETLAAVL